MNSEAIKQRLNGTGPLVIRTFDGREFAAAGGDFVGCTPHYIIIESDQGMVEVLPADTVAGIATPADALTIRNHAALLHGYAPEDEGLYDDVLRG